MARFVLAMFLMLAPSAFQLSALEAVTNARAATIARENIFRVMGGFAIPSPVLTGYERRDLLDGDFFVNLQYSYQNIWPLRDDGMYIGSYAEVLAGPGNSFMLAGGGGEIGFSVIKFQAGAGYCFSGFFPEVGPDAVRGSSLSLGMLIELIQRRSIGVSTGFKYYWIQGSDNVSFMSFNLGLHFYLASEHDNASGQAVASLGRFHFNLGFEGIWYGANSQAGGDHFGLGASAQINYSLAPRLHVGPYFGLGYITADADSKISSVMGKTLVPLAFGVTFDFNDRFFYRSRTIRDERPATPYVMIAPGGFFVHDYKGGETIVSSEFAPGFIFRFGVKHSDCTLTIGYHLSVYVPFARASPMLLLGFDL